MARKKDKQKVLAMRHKGMSYSQIKEKLGISKSTLSGWLYNMPLSAERIRELQADSPIRIEKYRNTMRAKREKKLLEAYVEMSKKIGRLSTRELFLAGLFLYWGEGNKQRGRVAISNTDPKVIQFALYWMVNALKIPKSKMRILLHLYSDMNIEKETVFWSKTIGIPVEQFSKPYIKKTTRQGLSYKSFGHGTCNLVCCDSALAEKIAMSIKAIAEYCGAKSEIFWYN